MTQADFEWDVVVAGAGMSGLAAGLAAAQAGARVLVVEKRDVPGGQAAISAGAIWAPPDIEAVREYVPDGDPALQQLLVANLPGDLDWLAANGLALSEIETLAGFGRGRVMLGGVSGAHDAFMHAFAERVRGAGGEIRQRAAIVAARREGSVFAVTLHDGSTHRSRTLVLATGGFQGSRQALARYLDADHADALVLRGLAESNGDGLAIGLGLGGSEGGDMGAFYGHTMPDFHLDVADMQPLTPYFARYGVLVNRNGERFVDEGAARLEEVNPQEGCRQPGGRYHLVFDRAIYETHGINQGVISAVPTLDRLARLMEMGAPVIASSTLEDLAKALGAEGVNGDRLLVSLRAYNRACAAETADELTPPRIRNAIALVQPPFYAMRCAPGITNTCGGLRINDACEVLVNAGSAVDGLYAAGVDAGGVFGRHYAGFLGWALASGRRSGASAARRALQ